MRLKNHDLLTVPDSYPIDRLDRRPKLLFVLDDLNQAIVSGRTSDGVEHEVKSMLLKSPLQVRLLETLKFYMKQCGPERVRVVATARNEKEREDEDIPSYWEQLEY